ncbi:MAG: histidine phosphatase family protein [Dermatophilaceae bacterium]
MPTRHSGFPAASVRRLVLVRHGQTAWNATRRAQGHADIGLDETGHAQATAAAPYLAALRPARLWTSDLSRASQTAAYVADLLGIPAEPDPRLREYSVGERSGLTRAQFSERFPLEYAAWERGDETVLVAGAESTDDVLGRMVPALREMLGSLAEGQTGMVVTHGACLRAAMLEVLGLGQSSDAAFATMGNCTWTTLQETEFGGGLRLAGYNVGVAHAVGVGPASSAGGQSPDDESAVGESADDEAGDEEAPEGAPLHTRAAGGVDGARGAE